MEGIREGGGGSKGGRGKEQGREEGRVHTVSESEGTSHEHRIRYPNTREIAPAHSDTGL